MSLKDVTGSISSTLYRQIGRASSQIQKNRSLPVDVLEDDESYLVVFDAPGVETEDVQVRYLDGTIKIRLDRFRTFYEGYDMQFPGRSMTLDGEADLPDDAVVDPDAGTARLTDNGTLNIDIPKRAALDDDESEDEADESESDAEPVSLED